jgi:hypothetical protein
MQVSRSTTRRAVCALAGLAFIAITPSQLHADPVNWSGDFETDGDSIEAELLGDYEDGVLTLNSAPPWSRLSVDLSDPDPVPLGKRGLADPCLFYSCTASLNLNSSLVIEFNPWAFALDGTLEFDELDPDGGTANLQAYPAVTTDAFTISALNIVPVFTVDAAQIYGPVNQALADAQAATTEAVLNTGNFNIDIWGDGYWETVDLGLITAELTELGNVAEVDMSFENIMMNGSLDYNSQITFDGAILNAVSEPFVASFNNAIELLASSAILFGINTFTDSTEGFEYTCSALEAGNGFLDVACTLSSGVPLAGDLPGGTRVSVAAPAMAGLFGLTVLGLAALRSRRRR